MSGTRREDHEAAVDRREFLRLAAMAGSGALLSAHLVQRRVLGADGQSAGAPELARFPEKTDLILLTDRPANLETPLKYFREDFTPNDAFFVRWHVAGVPTSIDAAAFRLSVKGHVEQGLELSLEQLRKDFEPVTLAAVNQCSGNSRSFFSPRVFGGQWGNGAMGNAKWTGVRLRDLLSRAKVKAGPVDVSFAGLDRSPVATVQNFVKSLPFDRANDGEVMVAYEMNGKPLPMLNGFPLRLIVPGWYATYWVKALNEITLLNEKFHGFWMDKAYRVPNNAECAESPQDLAKETVPISTMTTRSLFVRPEPGERIAAGTVEVEGLALDGGQGIRQVEVSADGGKTWSVARLDSNLGKYAWRRWRYAWDARPGRHQLMVRATNAAGQTQVTSQWNRSGYARNVIQQIDVTAG